MPCEACPPALHTATERHHLCGLVDVAVVTIIEKEEQAVLHLLDLQGAPRRHWLANGQSFTYGELRNATGQLRVAVVGVRDPGNTAMAAITALLQMTLLPRLSILVGIAAGLKSRAATDSEGRTLKEVSGVRVGHIFVPKKIIDFSFAAIEKGEDLATEKPRHEIYSISGVALSLSKRFSNEEEGRALELRDRYIKDKINNKWTSRIDTESFPRPKKFSREEWNCLINESLVDPKTLPVSEDHIASSNLLLKNEEVLQKLHLERYSRVKGGEMEAAGFAVASQRCKAEWLVIRVVSDLGDDAKSDDFQDYASANAAAYLATFLRDKIDVDLIRSNSAADTFRRTRKKEVEEEIKSILDAFASIFDQVGLKVNLEIYWSGQAKYFMGGKTVYVRGVIRDGNMKAERSGGLNRFEPRRFFAFSPKHSQPRAVAQCADPEVTEKEVFHAVKPEENTPLSWVYAIPIFSKKDYMGDKVGAICCTSTDPLFQQGDSNGEQERKRLRVRAMLGILRDLLQSAFVSTDRFFFVEEEVELGGEP